MAGDRTRLRSRTSPTAALSRARTAPGVRPIPGWVDCGAAGRGDRCAPGGDSSDVDVLSPATVSPELWDSGRTHRAREARLRGPPPSSAARGGPGESAWRPGRGCLGCGRQRSGPAGQGQAETAVWAPLSLVVGAVPGPGRRQLVSFPAPSRIICCSLAHEAACVLCRVRRCLSHR